MYEELIGLLRDYGRDCTGNDMCENCSIQYFCENGWTPSEIANAIEELSKPRWIPVTERLPLLNTPVLATDGIEVDILWMYGVPPRWITSYMAIDEDKITHWMPLPEPPKEES